MNTETPEGHDNKNLENEKRLKSLKGEVVEVKDLTVSQRDRLFVLMQSYFEGMERKVFEEDLAEKPWAILLYDPENHELFGFSTLCLMEAEIESRQVRAFFSGDTIIDRRYWGSMALEKAWSRFAFSKVMREPQYDWYWFLISKGYRTYRYLPVYLKKYYPNPEEEIPPFEKKVLDTLGQKRYGEYYNPETGIICYPTDYHLREGIGDITEKELEDPRIAFFQATNPGWAKGHELACLASLSLDNLKRTGQKVLGQS